MKEKLSEEIRTNAPHGINQKVSMRPSLSLSLSPVLVYEKKEKE